MRKLGNTQREVLRLLAESRTGCWYPWCGWLWGTHSGTERVLDSLVRCGLVVKHEKTLTPYSEIMDIDTTPYTKMVYEITVAGRKEAVRGK